MKTLKRINNLFSSDLKGAKMNNTRNNGKRAYIRQLLDRQSNYRVSDYVRKLRKDKGIICTASAIIATLNRMQKLHQLRYWVIDNKIVGFTRG